jgi:hypothetical protein
VTNVTVTTDERNVTTSGGAIGTASAIPLTDTWMRQSEAGIWARRATIQLASNPLVDVWHVVEGMVVFKNWDYATVMAALLRLTVDGNGDDQVALPYGQKPVYPPATAFATHPTRSVRIFTVVRVPAGNPYPIVAMELKTENVRPLLAIDDEGQPILRLLGRVIAPQGATMGFLAAGAPGSNTNLNTTAQTIRTLSLVAPKTGAASWQVKFPFGIQQQANGQALVNITGTITASLGTLVTTPVPISITPPGSGTRYETDVVEALVTVPAGKTATISGKVASTVADNHSILDKTLTNLVAIPLPS